MVYLALIYSNVSITKVIIWQMTSSACIGEIDSIGSGIPKKLKRPGKPEPTQFA